MGELQLKDKKFVRYEKGAELYDMCQKSFEKLARNANATYSWKDGVGKYADNR